VIEAAKAAKAGQFVFVSSAGMYKTSDEVPFLEGDKVKEDAGHALVEEALRKGSMKWASFRPQYLTGALPERTRSRTSSRTN
jgi:nucleoside-diphosphate-sugar epimerase